MSLVVRFYRSGLDTDWVVSLTIGIDHPRFTYQNLAVAYSIGATFFVI